MQPTVLIVDDEDGIRQYLVHTANALPCRTREATDGKAALESLATEPVDIIVSDIMMPNLNGLQFMKCAQEKGFEGPFILITGYGTSSTAAEALRLGAYDYLEKPFMLDDVIETLTGALEFANGLRSKSSTELEAYRDEQRASRAVLAAAAKFLEKK